MNTMKIDPYVAFVGIDWADTKHDVCIQAVDSTKREFVVVPHNIVILFYFQRYSM